MPLQYFKETAVCASYIYHADMEWRGIGRMLYIYVAVRYNNTTKYHRIYLTNIPCLPFMYNTCRKLFSYNTLV